MAEITLEELIKRGVIQDKKIAKDKRQLKLALRRYIEKKRYEYALSLGADVKTARRARAWSTAKKWQEELGTKVTEQRIPQYPKTRVHKPKSKKESAKQRRQRYRHLRRLGFSPKDASRGRSKTRYEKLIAKVHEPPKEEKQKKKLKRRTTRKAREKQWALWSKWASDKKDPRGFPKWVEDYIAVINKRRGLDAKAGYGFGIMWHWYTRGGTLKGWMKKLVPDDHDYDHYRFANTRALN